ncbi:MAG: DHH family phosphoesterase [Desulfurococcales archaeon]|jgi:nanoRNase/pAp phosphatase (c-di-AMP/oligoRNAs hydrolase)
MLDLEKLRGILRRVGEEIGDLSKEKKVAIASHPSADLDSISSALALSLLIKSRSNTIPCYISSGGFDTLAKRVYEDAVSKGYMGDCPANLQSNWILLVVDTPCRRASAECSSFDAVYVIDHHMSSGEEPRYPGIVYPEASSTTELCTLMLEETSTDIPDPQLANKILAGILYDTRTLTLASIIAIEATRYLMRWGARIGEALHLIRRSPGVDERIARLKAMSRVMIYRSGEILLCITHVGAYEASAAQILIGGGCDLAIVISEKDGETRVVGRCSEEFCREAGLGDMILDDLVKIYGGGWGGHRLAAVASVKASYEELLKKIPLLLGRKLGVEFMLLEK